MFNSNIMLRKLLQINNENNEFLDESNNNVEQNESVKSYTFPTTTKTITKTTATHIETKIMSPKIAVANEFSNKIENAINNASVKTKS